MKYPIYILATAGAAPNQLERYAPKHWTGELVDDLFQAQWFATAEAAARRLDELTKSEIRSDTRALGIYQISGVNAHRLNQTDQISARERALDEDLRGRMTPDMLDYFQRSYERRRS